MNSGSENVKYDRENLVISRTIHNKGNLSNVIEVISACAYD